MSDSNKRQDPFARLRTNPQEPIDLIPRAKPRPKKARTWEKRNPSRSYYIPENLHEKAKDVRAKILGLAQMHMATTSNVASALLGYSLAQVRQGKLEVEALPDINRRKMALTWEESDDDQSQDIQPIKKANKGKSKKALYLNYRWSKDLDKQIHALADSISIGELTLFLLNYALEAYENGRLKLKERPITMGQKVSSEW